MSARQTKYVLGERIAQGGMAEVHIGKVVGSEGFMRICAMKKVLPQFSSDGEFVDMFKAEADTTKLLQHKNIVQIYDFVNDGSGAMLVMEFIDGQDLRSVLRTVEQRKLRIPLELSCYICSEVLSGLGYAHSVVDVHGNSKGIIHRDVSPQNVIVSYEGDVKILDFGIAKVQNAANATRAGVLKGKFRYMSPEQAAGQNIDARSDVFAVGVVLWEMLTLTRLFRGEDDIQVLQAVRECRVKPPSSISGVQIPRELETVVMRLLAKDLTERYQTAKDAARDLSKFLYSVRSDFFPGELADFMQKLFKDRIRMGRERMRTTLALPVETGRLSEDGMAYDGEIPNLFPGGLGGDAPNKASPAFESRVPQPPQPEALARMVHGTSGGGVNPVRMENGSPASAVGENPPRYGEGGPAPSLVGHSHPMTATLGTVGRVRQRGYRTAQALGHGSHFPIGRSRAQVSVLPKIFLFVSIIVVAAIGTFGAYNNGLIGFESSLSLQPGVLMRQARVILEIDGKRYSPAYVQLPISLKFKRGVHQIVVKRPGFQNYSLDFEGSLLGRHKAVDVALKPKVPLGTAQIFTVPEGGRIDMDNGYVVANSGEMIAFLPVRHRYQVVVERRGCPKFTTTVYVPPTARQQMFIHTINIPGC